MEWQQSTMYCKHVYSDLCQIPATQRLWLEYESYELWSPRPDEILSRLHVSLPTDFLL